MKLDHDSVSKTRVHCAALLLAASTVERKCTTVNKCLFVQKGPRSGKENWAEQAGLLQF